MRHHPQLEYVNHYPNIITRQFGTPDYPRFDFTETWHDAHDMASYVRGKMDSQGALTPAGLTAFENNNQVDGALAVKIKINDDGTVKLDFRIVDDAGSVLAEWPGVDVVDDTQVTWVFSDAGKFKLSMEPIELGP
jgi:hypothetical protein